MDKDSKFGFKSLSDSRVLVVGLAVAGVIFVQSTPLENTRLPVNEPQHLSPQEINARSWQDPFAAIEKHRSAVRKNGGSANKQEDGQVPTDKLGELIAAGPTEIIVALVPDRPYSEDGETRRRMRYAVIAGLNAKHLVSERSERLGYFIPKLASCGDKAGATQSAPAPIPFEWYRPPVAGASAKVDLKPRVLVMWLSTEDFGAEPICQLTALKATLHSTTKTWRVIGPFGSDGLKALIDETEKSNLPQQKATSLRFYSPFATATDKRLLEDVREPPDRPKSLSSFFDSKKAGVSLVRTIGNDDALADALIQELKLRGVVPRSPANSKVAQEQDPCALHRKNGKAPLSRIAIVAERDTLYARSMLGEFGNRSAADGFCIDSFDYLRGLDGELPTDGTSAQRPEAAPRAAQAAKNPNGVEEAVFTELAAGQQQFDYLRRIAVRLRERDSELRRESADDRGGLRAIGVLGTDVHDKLLVLQALKPEFPDVVFFTTDIDARFLHPREQGWTRNMIVASNYGLRLSDEFQGGAPPFRDSYQTSVYLSTMLAVTEGQSARQRNAGIAQSHANTWFGKPRVFEIGRTAAFDFSDPAPDVDARGCEYDLTKCTNVHPPGSARFPALRSLTLFMFFSLVVLSLWLTPLMMLRSARQAILSLPKDRPTHFRIAATGGFVLLLQVALPLWLTSRWVQFAGWLTTDASPLVAFEGISLWPTETIRAFTILLCVYLLLRGQAKLAENLDDIGHDLDLGGSRHQVVAAEQDNADPSLPAKLFWRDYVRQNSLLARSVRTGGALVMVFLAGWLLLEAFGDKSLFPSRGAVSRSVHVWLELVVLTMMGFVVLFVVDTVVACTNFVDHLDDAIRTWPQATLDKFRELANVPGELLPSWIELQFIVRRTKAVAGLVYYPFLIPSLLMLSTSGFFGAQRIPIGPVILALIGVVVAVFCAWSLNRAAAQARTRILCKIDAALMRAKGPPAASSEKPTATIDQLNFFRAKVAALDEGAFAPFWERTMFTAMLIPFAAIGSTSLVAAWLSRLLGGL
ncbi:hypothetical protein QTH90_21325 [Variovorax sp. J2P1-59]|uniref:hypothetical protein n=1 Tax=Variovorax flavidus TaxID=3053501 RepID=UPI00257869DB|nr:hypothetical protein [Variovorax sp. J2P1-59]MDM0076965.1 hypothetical protein [Variovorax sp. J2P1-59]